MPLINWLNEPITIIQGFEARRAGRGEAGALIFWATRAVEELHYLEELERARPALPFSPDVNTVNDAHFRWSCTTATTALDLCAATLGREHCGATGQEFSLRHFAPTPRNAANRIALPPTALIWVDAAQADTDYSEILGGRHRVTHARLTRSLLMSDARATEYRIPSTGNSFTTGQMVCLARDFAARHVIAFLAVVAAL